MAEGKGCVGYQGCGARARVLQIAFVLINIFFVVSST